jgi:Response regulator containing a CheY-like receiver domain and a GGDEF domain
MNNDLPTTDRGNILVVDDTPANLRLLAGILNGQGYKVRPVPSGELALSAATGMPPDLILLDIMMPEMNGYEVCEKIKADERTRNIPVIFISAINDVLDKVKAFAVGGVDYITKPFQMEEVLVRVETHLAMCQLQKKLQQKNDELTVTLDQLQATQNQLVQSEKMAA